MRALYPGTFDPITNGHEDLARRAASMFDEVVVAVAGHTGKNSLFSLEERTRLASEALKDAPRIRVIGFQGLLIDCVRREKAQVILRGLRAISDFEYEFQLASVNRKLAPDTETLFLMTNDAHTFLSSSLVRELARLGGDVTSFVSPVVVEALREKFQAS